MEAQGGFLPTTRNGKLRGTSCPQRKSVPPGPRQPVATDGPRKKLAYMEQREWDGMEAKILEAEQDLAAWQQELQAAASDAKRVAEAYEKVQDAQRRVEDLYARWAELEAKVSR